VDSTSLGIVYLMNKIEQIRCTICDRPEKELTHLELYIIGCEGIDVCLSCRIFLTNVARGLMEQFQSIRKDLALRRIQ